MMDQKGGRKCTHKKGKQPAPKRVEFSPDNFKAFLTSVAGGTMSPKQARKFAFDVSKYLETQARDSSTTDADLILDIRKITAWIEEQCSCKLSASILINKVYNLSASIKHICHIYSPFKQSPDFVHGVPLSKLAG